MTEMSFAEWLSVAGAAGTAIGVVLALPLRLVLLALREATKATKEQTEAIVNGNKEQASAIAGLRESFAELRGALDVLLDRAPVESPRGMRESTYHIGRAGRKDG